MLAPLTLPPLPLAPGLLAAGGAVELPLPEGGVPDVSPLPSSLPPQATRSATREIPTNESKLRALNTETSCTSECDVCANENKEKTFPRPMCHSTRESGAEQTRE